MLCVVHVLYRVPAAAPSEPSHRRENSASESVRLRPPRAPPNGSKVIKHEAVFLWNHSLPPTCSLQPARCSFTFFLLINNGETAQLQIGLCFQSNHALCNQKHPYRLSFFSPLDSLKVSKEPTHIAYNNVVMNILFSFSAVKVTDVELNHCSDVAPGETLSRYRKWLVVLSL